MTDNGEAERLPRARTRRWYREWRPALARATPQLLTMVTLALLGNFASAFCKAGDTLHAVLALVAALCLVAVFWMNFWRIGRY